MFLVYLTVILTLILITPLFINFDAFFDKKINKLFYSIRLFNVFTINSGYIEIKIEGFIFHVSKNKAIIYPFTKLISFNPDLSLFKGVEILKINGKVFYGNTKSLITPFSTCAFLKLILNEVSKVLINYKSFLTVKNYFLITDKEDVFNVYVSLKTLCNGFVLSAIFIKLIIGKILDAKNSKRKQS